MKIFAAIMVSFVAIGLGSACKTPDRAASHLRDGEAGSSPAADPFDLTFFVVADTHADPGDSYDLLAMVRTINAVGKGGQWPETIDGQTTGFLGGAIAEPRGVVFAGDLTGTG